MTRCLRFISIVIDQKSMGDTPAEGKEKKITGEKQENLEVSMEVLRNTGDRPSPLEIQRRREQKLPLTSVARSYKAVTSKN